MRLDTIEGIIAIIAFGIMGIYALYRIRRESLKKYNNDNCNKYAQNINNVPKVIQDRNKVSISSITNNNCSDSSNQYTDNYDTKNKKPFTHRGNYKLMNIIKQLKQNLTIDS